MQSWQTDKDQSNLTIKEQSFAGCSLFFKDNIYLFLGIFIAVAICMYGIVGIYGFSAFPDEFGYWSPAAAMLGYDWSQITSLGSYYSYGYSILLVPVLFLFHDPVVAYRAAVILNLSMQCVSFPLLYLVLKELFPQEKKRMLSIATAVAIIYPAWMFYVQTTMAEALLYFLFILAAFVMMRFLKKPGFISGACLGVALVYLYLVHMRCVGTIGAGVLTLVLFFFFSRRGKEKAKGVNKAWILILFIVIMFGISFALKDKVIAVLYHGTSSDVLSWNDYSGIAFRIKKILNLKGILYLLEDVCGKILYIGLATCGIAYFGIFGCVRRAIGAFLMIKNKKGTYLDFLWIYIALAVLFQFFVALIYLNGASAPTSDRLDNFLHGRYIDFFLPTLVATGIIEALRYRHAYLGFEITFCLYLVLSMVAMLVINVNDTYLHNAHGFTMIGMSYFLVKPLLDTQGYFAVEVAFQTGLTLVCFILFILARRLKQDVLIAGVLIIQIALGVNACTHYIFANQSYIFGDVLLGHKVVEICQKNPDKQLLFVYEGGVQYIELVQMTARDQQIDVINGEFEDIDIKQYLDTGTIMLLDEDAAYLDQARDYYEEEWHMGHMVLYYSP